MKTRILLLSLAAVALGMHSPLAQEPENPAQVLVNGALEDFEAKKYDDALTKLQEAEKLDPSSAFIANLIGAAYTKKKEFALAKGAFEKSLSADPGFFPSLFNIGELLFLQKQYPQALDYFSKMLARDPGNELLQFKVVLCLLKTEQAEDAKKLAGRMRFPGDGPAWYYSQAALQMHADNKRKARDLLATAKTMFPDKISLYSETFDDLGWPTK